MQQDRDEPTPWQRKLAAWRYDLAIKHSNINTLPRPDEVVPDRLPTQTDELMSTAIRGRIGQKHHKE